MKKLTILLVMTVFLLTGCSIIRLDSKDLDKVVNTMLSEDIKLHNIHFDGYKYYLPKGFSFINKDEYNALISDKYNNKYYIYVDIVSFYHKIEKEYKVNKDSYYSKAIKNNKGFGYIEINQKDEKFFIEAMYHYMKIEAYVNEEELVESLSQLCSILNSVSYNQKVLESTIGENILNYKEETFDIFNSKKKGNSEEDFLKYVEEYDKLYETNDELLDEGNLEIEQE